MAKLEEKDEEKKLKEGMNDSDYLIKIYNILEDCLIELKK